MASQVYGLFTIVFLLGCLWFLAYIMTKFIGNKSKSAMRSKYMVVVDTMTIGFDKTLYLVKIGGEYVLMYSSTKGFEYICTLDRNAINVDEKNFNSSESSSSGFSKYFDFFKPGAEPKSDEDNDVENNLEKLRKLFKKD